MAERYTKRGRSVRFENGVLLRASEAGEAIEEGVLFTCRPFDATPLPEIDATGVEHTADAIRAAAGDAIERLIIAEGVADHQFGEVRWSERHRRIHADLVRGALRASVDILSFDVEHVLTIARALAAVGPERRAPSRVRLAPHVAAALIPLLIGVAPPNVTLVQKAGGRDGKGQQIEERVIESPPWPNWYRPSYRVRPLRQPLNLSVRCDVTDIDEELPRAVALLAPCDRVTLHVLVEDRGRVYPAKIRIARIHAVARETTFYPYGAGSFGAEMVL